MTVDDINALRTARELSELIRSYNWDDGFDIPAAVAEHQQCDLGVALELFALSDAMSVYLKEVEPKPWKRDWIAFCERLAHRILTGAYKPGTIKFQSELTATQAYKLRKRGVPEVLISGSYENL
jgi:Domain of unknown function (DUF4274)